jgi:hypothetical protein
LKKNRRSGSKALIGIRQEPMTASGRLTELIQGFDHKVPSSVIGQEQNNGKEKPRTGRG